MIVLERLIKVKIESHGRSENVVARCWSTCSRPHYIQGGSKRDNILERTGHMT